MTKSCRSSLTGPTPSPSFFISLKTFLDQNPREQISKISSRMQGSPREFDAVILGASGFTGKYVIAEAIKHLCSPNSPLKSLAIAGRSTTKLSQTLAWARSQNPQITPPSDIHVIQCDVHNQSSLYDLAERTRIVLDCVGPFRLYGRPVVQACVGSGTDYLDISGEPEFMERMEAEYGEVAVDKGSLVISACGFDSVPAELGVMFNGRQWVGNERPNKIDAYLLLESEKRMVGNIGTYESAVLGVANAAQLMELRKSRPRRAQPQIPGPPPSKGSLIEYQESLGFWAIRLPSADSIVVRRTIAALTENPHGLPGTDETEDQIEKRKSFWASIKPVHFGVKLGQKSLLGIIGVMVMALFLGLFGMFSFGRKLLLKFPEIFSLGWFSRTGPTEEEVRSATFKMWFVGRGYSNASALSGKGEFDMEIVTSISGPEIGYLTTPIILVQCALILLGQRGNLPKGGVYPPGIVFGPTGLQEKLQENGISFEVLSKKRM